MAREELRFPHFVLVAAVAIGLASVDAGALTGSKTLVLSGPNTTWRVTGGVLVTHTMTDGKPSGYVVTGSGEMVMSIQLPIEVRQLARFSGESADDPFTEKFKQMVVRTTRDLTGALPAGAGENSGGISEDRHRKWLRVGYHDIDGRVNYGSHLEGDDYLWVEMETERFGWLAYEHDPLEIEPTALMKLHTGRQFTEEWIRLPRQEEVSWQGGDPSGLNLHHVEAKIDLTDHRASEVIRTLHPEPLHFNLRVLYSTSTDGLQAVRWNLHPWAKVSAVKDSDGNDLQFERAAIGELFAGVENHIHDNSIVVYLNTPLASFEETEMAFEYDLKTYNYVSGGSWYPTGWDAVNDPHTARLEFTHDADVEIRGVGKPISEEQRGKLKVTVWQMDTPTKLLAFSFGKGYRQESLKLDGAPEVIVWGRETGLTTGNMVKNVAIDIANSLHFFQWYFDYQLPTQQIYVSRIHGYHGQSMEGFIQLSMGTFNAETGGAAELFRAHEAAHQFWGHVVGWQTYRDQWLSEALAEYSAMLYIEATMGDTGYFDEIVRNYIGEQVGSIAMRMSRFRRGWLEELMDPNLRDELGPIGVGYRASTERVPYGYQVQIYNKGAMVIHMIRMLLHAATGNDELFRGVMQDFVKSNAGKAASTDDLQAALTRRAPQDWTWFFDQWVYRTEIPGYVWSWEVGKKKNPDGMFELKVRIEQREVQGAFTMFVPLHIIYAKDEVRQVLLPVKLPEETFTIPVPAKPKDVKLNDNNAVIAKVREK